MNQFKVGDRVVYTPKKESGVVTSVKEWVFVRYDGSKHEHGIATHPKDLEPEHDNADI